MGNECAGDRQYQREHPLSRHGEFPDGMADFTTRDYRLFDIQHAVLPTKLPLSRFYQELVATQQVLNMKHLGLRP